MQRKGAGMHRRISFSCRGTDRSCNPVSPHPNTLAGVDIYATDERLRASLEGLRFRAGGLVC
jgi:hypothetical protein